MKSPFAENNGLSALDKPALNKLVKNIQTQLGQNAKPVDWRPFFKAVQAHEERQKKTQLTEVVEALGTLVNDTPFPNLLSMLREGRQEFVVFDQDIKLQQAVAALVKRGLMLKYPISRVNFDEGQGERIHLEGTPEYAALLQDRDFAAAWNAVRDDQIGVLTDVRRVDTATFTERGELEVLKKTGSKTSEAMTAENPWSDALKSAIRLHDTLDELVAGRQRERFRALLSSFNSSLELRAWLTYWYRDSTTARGLPWVVQAIVDELLPAILPDPADTDLYLLRDALSSLLDKGHFEQAANLFAQVTEQVGQLTTVSMKQQAMLNSLATVFWQDSQEQLRTFTPRQAREVERVSTALDELTLRGVQQERNDLIRAGLLGLGAILNVAPSDENLTTLHAAIDLRSVAEVLDEYTVNELTRAFGRAGQVHFKAEETRLDRRKQVEMMVTSLLEGWRRSPAYDQEKAERYAKTAGVDFV